MNDIKSIIQENNTVLVKMLDQCVADIKEASDLYPLFRYLFTSLEKISANESGLTFSINRKENNVK